MRGPGQIAELTAIAEPDVGVIIDRRPGAPRAAGLDRGDRGGQGRAVAGLRPGGDRVVPAGEPLLDAHRRDDVTTVTFGPGGDVDAAAGRDGLSSVRVCTLSAHMRRNALAALAAARAVGVEPDGRLDVALSSLRGQRIELPGGIVVVNDCYNANPMSMRAALDDLAASASGRRVAVLGDMLELGPDEGRFHARDRRARPRRRGRRARRRRARAPRTTPTARRRGASPCPTPRGGRRACPGLLAPGDTVLVKGSRGVGLEVVARALEGALMGEILIAGTASLLICIFLGPRFIEFLRDREFGQHIREEGPAGHHDKAGTPTMGGLIIFLADLGAVPDPDRLRLARGRRCSARRVACALLGFADDFTKIVKRRSLGLRARTKLLRRRSRSRSALWWLATEKAGLQRHAAPARRRRHRSTSASSTRCSSTSCVAGTTNG